MNKPHPANPRRGRAHWYRIEIRECPACGRNTEYRERHYGKKPQQTNFYAQLWCGACFEIERLRDERDALREALAQSIVALDDWLNLYASEECPAERVYEAKQRISQMGTVAYIAEVQAVNRAALAAASPTPREQT